MDREHSHSIVLADHPVAAAVDTVLLVAVDSAEDIVVVAAVAGEVDIAYPEVAVVAVAGDIEVVDTAVAADKAVVADTEDSLAGSHTAAHPAV